LNIASVISLALVCMACCSVADPRMIFITLIRHFAIAIDPAPFIQEVVRIELVEM